MNTSLDISNNKSLLPLAKVVNAVQAAARDSGREIILVGAAARDIRLTHMHGIPIDRATEDVDFAVMVDDWSDFEALRNSLIATGDFQQRPRGAHHRLRHRSGLPLDIVPFGGIERIDRTIVWPPDQSIVMDCFGMNEALNTCSLVRLPAGAEIDIPSIAALALLKIQAWQDRKYVQPGKDARDFIDYVRHYLSCGTMDHATTQHADLFDVLDLDYEEVSAQLLARDVSPLLDKTARKRICDLLAPEGMPDGAMLMARQSGYDAERACALIGAFWRELTLEKA